MGTTSADVSRRSFFRTAAVGTGAVAAGLPLLSACGDSGATSGATGTANSTAGLAGVLPAYVPAAAGPKPDLPSVTGVADAATDPGFLTYPKTMVAATTGVPGKGGSYRAVTPLWGAIPAAGNPYYQAVNKALGAELTMQPADGNTYAQVVPTLVAGNKLPDWLQIPTWWNGALNVGELAVSKFADLTDLLSGDKIKAYPNLAAIPTGGWQAGAWNNRLYGIPSFTSAGNFAGALFYRKDVFESKGISPDSVKDAESLLALGKELSAPKANVWAFEVNWLMIQQIFGVLPLGAAVTVIDGKVVSAFDTPQLEAALEYAYRTAKSGYVHPDALADDNANSKQRFWSGKVLVVSDGVGAWNGADGTQGRAANPDYLRAAFPLFAHDAATKPTIAIGNSAALVSYLNKSLTADQLKECLAIANYLASPYGSTEYTLLNYGVEGRHWTAGATGPQYTTQGTKEASNGIYFGLASARNITTNPGREDVTKDVHGWASAAVQLAYKPPFWNLNVNPPSSLAAASAATQVNDVLKQVTYGKKTVADFTAAAASWKSSGGTALIDWYQKNVVDKYGTGQ